MMPVGILTQTDIVRALISRMDIADMAGEESAGENPAAEQ
jgi:hypothetical protein